MTVATQELTRLSLKMQKQTTIRKRKTPRDAPLVSGSGEELFNSTNQKSTDKAEPCGSDSQVPFHCRSGCNRPKWLARMSRHSVFVLDADGKPLTPTTPAKAKKLMKGKVAKPKWNKFGQFGIQMLVETRKETPKTVLGVDLGTKFEGYSVVTSKENNLSVMWKLPDKKQLVRKLEERRNLRKARKHRDCRRRPCRSNNRKRDNFIAPSQWLLVNSRLKAIREFAKYYPLDAVAIEDVRFNHSKKRWGKNFTTMEIGKNFIYDTITKELDCKLVLYQGHETEELRKLYSYHKSKTDKSKEIPTTHCCDSMAIAIDVYAKHHIHYGKFIVVDDTYRCVRRKLHKTQFKECGIRKKYSSGNFKSIKKGTICEVGQICGGKYNRYTNSYNWKNKRIQKSLSKITWLSKRFKIKEGI